MKLHSVREHVRFTRGRPVPVIRHRRGRDVCYIDDPRGPEKSLERSVPPEVMVELRRADTPGKIAGVLSRAEAKIGAYDRSIRSPREYLDCDEMATLMGYALRMHFIPYEDVVGENRSGDSHAWVRVEGHNYDPTRQGMKRGRVVSSWDPFGPTP